MASDRIKFLTIAITAQCNRYCEYCPIVQWRNNEAFPDKLTLEAATEAIDMLQPTHVEVTGGEPTLVTWLDSLLDFLEAAGIPCLVKSNGFKRCRHQITAWHSKISELPANYDKILIIKDTDEWELKRDWCIEKRIPHAVIGKNYCYISYKPQYAHHLFLCPDGRFKQCQGKELENGAVEWAYVCDYCKALDDFMVFL